MCNFYGTSNLSFAWVSTVTGTTRIYVGINAFNAESGIARDYCGMHFRFAIMAEEELSKLVGRSVAKRHYTSTD